MDIQQHDLEAVLRSRTRVSSGGFPYLHRSVWGRLRDWVPMILDGGQEVLDAVDQLEKRLPQECSRNAKVVRQVVNTAAITAPSDLWLMRFVQSALCESGIASRLLQEEVIMLDDLGLLKQEILVDFLFLLSRGTLVRQGRGYRLADHAAARSFLSLPQTKIPAARSNQWIAAFAGDEDQVSLETDSAGDDAYEPGIWHPTSRQIEVAAELVPLVVAMKASGYVDKVLPSGEFGTPFGEPSINRFAENILRDAGVLAPSSGVLTTIGRRVLERGPGPFGIIEAYRGYMDCLPSIWSKGRGEVWVERSANVAASQSANSKSFTRAHDSLDSFCAASGFSYGVFIEHAVGKGEAIRQRYERSGTMTYVGADLEDDAIAAAQQELETGALPDNTKFISGADIGTPETLLDGLNKLNISSDGAVMMVGNGFHEARNIDDEGMTEVFRKYEQAGLILIFTEETALSIDILLETAFNTYHAGFRYVHERSGQSLRPATESPPSRIEGERPASWSECAEAAGYIRAEAFCRKSRTVFPYTPATGFNPSISVDHFFVPGKFAHLLER